MQNFVSQFARTQITAGIIKATFFVAYTAYKRCFQRSLILTYISFYMSVDVVKLGFRLYGDGEGVLSKITVMLLAELRCATSILNLAPDDNNDTQLMKIDEK